MLGVSIPQKGLVILQEICYTLAVDKFEFQSSEGISHPASNLEDVSIQDIDVSIPQKGLVILQGYFNLRQVDKAGVSIPQKGLVILQVSTSTKNASI